MLFRIILTRILVVAKLGAYWCLFLSNCITYKTTYTGTMHIQHNRYPADSVINSFEMQISYYENVDFKVDSSYNRKDAVPEGRLSLIKGNKDVLLFLKPAFKGVPTPGSEEYLVIVTSDTIIKGDTLDLNTPPVRMLFSSVRISPTFAIDYSTNLPGNIIVNQQTDDTLCGRLNFSGETQRLTDTYSYFPGPYWVSAQIEFRVVKKTLKHPVVIETHCFLFDEMIEFIKE